jgi:hypothetical protein
MTRILTVFFLLICSAVSVAQDTLPDFTATTRGKNRVIISWTNTYPVIKQIGIQRSFDSTRNFKTILTVPDPTVPQNGFVDTKASTPYMFYRLFIVLDSGKYVFSRSRRAIWDTTKAGSEPLTDTKSQPVNGSKQVVVSEQMSNQEVEQLKDKLEDIKQPEKVEEKKVIPEKFFVVIRNDSIIRSIPEKQYKRFRDSVVNRTKDTLLFSDVDTITIRVFVPKEVYKPSRFVYTERDGNITINLPEAPGKDFSIRFFEDDLTPIFEVKKVKEARLTLDKANFLHAGWFRFELYEDGKLKEKHRFFIPRD